MNEVETPAEHIDPGLDVAGWGVIDRNRFRREYPIAPGRIEGRGMPCKSLTAGYVLEYRNTKLAVIEAKVLGEELAEKIGRANMHVGKLAVRLIDSTNGRGILIFPNPGRLAMPAAR